MTAAYLIYFPIEVVEALEKQICDVMIKIYLFSQYPLSPHSINQGQKNNVIIQSNC